MQRNFYNDCYEFVVGIWQLVPMPQAVHGTYTTQFISFFNLGVKNESLHTQLDLNNHSDGVIREILWEVQNVKDGGLMDLMLFADGSIQVEPYSFFGHFS
jgi:hypothetical protein